MTTATATNATATNATARGKNTAPKETAEKVSALKKPIVVKSDRFLGISKTGARKFCYTVLFRGVALGVSYVTAFVVAIGAVPALAAWLHNASGLGQGQLTTAGIVALWLAPLLFLILLLAAATWAVTVATWRWATRRIHAKTTVSA